jgi:hypothetical protein
MLDSERLARRWFSLVERRSFEQLADLAHPAIVVVSKVRPGLVVEGKPAFARFVEETLGPTLHDAIASRYRPLDEERIVVEGRIRWMDEEHVLRDDPVMWAMSFEDGLLIRFVAARSLVEAEATLARKPSER